MADADIPKPRVYVSVPCDANLSDWRRVIKHGLLETIERAGLEPQEFTVSGLPKNMGYGFKQSLDVMSRCQGAVVLGFERHRFETADGPVSMPTEWNHFEGALAFARGLPILVVAEEGTSDNGIFWHGSGLALCFLRPNANRSWLKSDHFKQRFDAWRQEVQERPRVFLGYCSRAKTTADALSLYMERDLGVSTRNYALDFVAGPTILSQISDAADKCSVGVFLFTKDDELAGAEGEAAPSNNVVFEAGYFMNARGPQRSLIIRENGARMPADLGGAVYITLLNRNDISTTNDQLRRALKASL
jgi:hypothetical protein